jgi:DUF4097 and DUF4098 domain-containing protein YvlB
MTTTRSVRIDPKTPVRVTSRSGAVSVTGENRDDVLVESGADHVDPGPAGLEIFGRSGAVVVRCPVGTDVFVGSASGSVELRGQLGDARVTTASGSIVIEAAARVEARTGSGSIEVGDCAGDCHCHSGSGRLEVGRAGSVDLATGSGSVEAERVGAAQVRAGSGSVNVGLTAPGSVVVEAHSGSVTVTVPHDMHPEVDLRARSGSVRCDCEAGLDGRIRVSTGSGAITVTTR